MQLRDRAAAAPEAVLPSLGSRPEVSSGALRHDSLSARGRTDFPLRHFFNPASGWFRRTERKVSKLIYRHLYPRIPGLSIPYRMILSRRLTVSEVEIGLEGLGGTGTALRVLQLSDIHAGPFVTPETLDHTFARLMAVEPDLVLLTGDFATMRVAEVEAALDAFRRLEAPLGVFGVLGNHDHYTEDPGRLCRLLEKVGVRVLRNRSIRIARDGAELLLAGIDDLIEGRPRLHEALDGRPERMPTLLMSHNPDIFPQAVELNVSLVVAGHTHGGQIRLPGSPVLVRQSRFRLDEGHYRAGESQLVVSRGLGASGLPLRFACPPEAVLLRLRPA